MRMLFDVFKYLSSVIRMKQMFKIVLNKYHRMRQQTL